MDCGTLSSMRPWRHFYLKTPVYHSSRCTRKVLSHLSSLTVVGENALAALLNQQMSQQSQHPNRLRNRLPSADAEEDVGETTEEVAKAVLAGVRSGQTIAKSCPR